LIPMAFTLINNGCCEGQAGPVGLPLFALSATFAPGDIGYPRFGGYLHRKNWGWQYISTSNLRQGGVDDRAVVVLAWKPKPKRLALLRGRSWLGYFIPHGRIAMLSALQTVAEEGNKGDGMGFGSAGSSGPALWLICRHRHVDVFLGSKLPGEQSRCELAAGCFRPQLGLRILGAKLPVGGGGGGAWGDRALRRFYIPCRGLPSRASQG